MPQASTDKPAGSSLPQKNKEYPEPTPVDNQDGVESDEYEASDDDDDDESMDEDDHTNDTSQNLTALLVAPDGAEEVDDDDDDDYNGDEVQAPKPAQASAMTRTESGMDIDG